MLLGGSAREEHAYLSDFGLTRLLASETHLTETGQWMGTIDFSAPEQLSGYRIDARADVYSLGCVLHAALVGTPPYPRGTLPATLLAHIQEPVPRPSESGAPAGFDRVMARALAKDPERRYPSAGDLGRAALAAARGELVTESERSVAVGPAGRDRRPPTNGHAGPPTAMTVADSPPTAATVAAPPATRVKEISPLIPPPPGDAPVRHRGRRRGVVVLGGALVAAVAAATALGLADGGGAGAGSSTAALSDGDVRDVAEDFAQAYEAEDGAALRRVLTPGVQRVLPSGVARGRSRVVNEYERQFRAQDTRGYELQDLDVHGGRVGRASGGYRVSREGRDAIEGRIVFGVVRDRGQPRIALIAVTPRAEPSAGAGDDDADGAPAPDLAARRRLLLADAEALRDERVEEAAAARAVEAEAATLDPALGIVDTGADEVRHRHPLLARDAEGGERRRAVAGRGGDVDDVGPGLERDLGAEAAAADLRAPPLDLHLRGARADAAGDLHGAAEDERGVGWARDLQLHRRLRLWCRAVPVTAAGEDENCADEGSGPNHGAARLAARRHRVGWWGACRRSRHDRAG